MWQVCHNNPCPLLSYTRPLWSAENTCRLPRAQRHTKYQMNSNIYVNFNSIARQFFSSAICLVAVFRPICVLLLSPYLSSHHLPSPIKPSQQIHNNRCFDSFSADFNSETELSSWNICPLRRWCFTLIPSAAQTTSKSGAFDVLLSKYSRCRLHCPPGLIQPRMMFLFWVCFGER